MARLDEEILSRRRHGRDHERAGLHGRATVRAGAQAMWRRSNAREPDEAGSQSEERRVTDAAAGNQTGYKSDRLLPDQADADAALRRNALGALRRGNGAVAP